MLMEGALKGITVLDISRMLPGPYCSMVLADHGAEVISIERSKYKDEGLFFSVLNRNKKHMTLDLKSKQGLKIFFELVEKADIIIEGFRPGVAQRLGIDYDTVREKNPRIIYCSISGYGQSGERRDLPGHDVNYLSTAGVLGLIGEKDRLSVIPGIQIADIAGGSMNAITGILLALYARDRIGKGQYIDISMTDGVLGLLSLAQHFTELEGKPAEAGNALLSHRYACYNTYETKDGRCVSLGAVENSFWKTFCIHIGRPDFAPLQYDEDKKDEIIQFLRDLFITRTYGEWVRELEPLGVCFTGVKLVSEVYADATFTEREMIVDYVDSQGQQKTSFGIPVKLSETPGAIRSQPAEFGRDTEKILLDLGYSKNDIEAFQRAGVV